MSICDAPVTAPFPVNLQLAGVPVLVVGGGRVALRKTSQLLTAGATVTVVAPDVIAELSGLPVTVERRRYRSGEVADFRLAITCTDDPAVNAAVFADGEAAQVWVNSADDPENCAFTLSSVMRQGDLQIAISTGGRSPALAMWLRRRFEREFGAEWSDLLDLLAAVRSEVRSHFGTSEVPGWMDALDDGVPELVARGAVAEARSVLRARLGLPVAAGKGAS